MKKLLYIIVILSFYSCHKEIYINRYSRYILRFAVNFETAPASAFRCTIECTDNVAPKPLISAEGNFTTLGFKTLISFKSHQHWGHKGIRKVFISHPVLDKDRIFELEVYRYNKIVLTKKITLRTSRNRDDRLTTSKIVVTPMDNFVKVARDDGSAFTLNL